jgi:carbon monoxide dehydrogenase subunit G
MKLHGVFEVSRGRPEAYAFLTDPANVAAALPDTSIAEVRPDGFTVEARVGVGPMRGTMSTRLDVVEREPDCRALYRGQARGLGSIVDLSAGFDLEEIPGGGTRVDWSGEANVSGRLASVAGGLLEPLARKNIERFITAVQDRLEG